MSSEESNLSRRDFIAVSAAIAVSRRALVPPLTDVTIVQFSDTGERQGPVRVPKVVKSDAEWRKQLSPLAFEITRRAGTERPFSGAYWDLHQKGLFRCICCDTPLFSSAAKFDSGTGWPSYWQPIAEENVNHGAPSPGDRESEVTCRRCDAHLGDLFKRRPETDGFAILYRFRGVEVCESQLMPVIQLPLGPAPTI